MDCYKMVSVFHREYLMDKIRIEAEGTQEINMG